eukprot:2638157-Amphidinium_carterae.1
MNRRLVTTNHMHTRLVAHEMQKNNYMLSFSDNLPPTIAKHQHHDVVFVHVSLSRAGCKCKEPRADELMNAH